MAAVPRSAAKRVIELTLELEAGSDPISGTVRGSGAAEIAFVGWLSLSVALDDLRNRDVSQATALAGLGIAQHLTRTEREVVDLLCLGLTNPQIADRLFVSHRTVQGHLGRIFRKFNVRSRTELAALVLRSAGSSRAEIGPDGPKDNDASHQT